MNPLKEQRLRAGLSREALSAKAQVSPAYIASLEGGYLPGRSEALKRIVAALDSAPPAPMRSPGGGQRWTKRPEIRRAVKGALAALEDDQPEVARHLLKDILPSLS